MSGQITLPQVKSILKPTAALSPPKATPPRPSGKDASPNRTSGRKTSGKSPGRSPRSKTPEQSIDGANNLPNPFQSSPKTTVPRSPLAQLPARVALRTEEEQQAAAKERERLEILAAIDGRGKPQGMNSLRLQDFCD